MAERGRPPKKTWAERFLRADGTRKWNYSYTKMTKERRKALELRIMGREYLTGIDEIAAYLGTSENSVRICIRYKGLPAIKGLGTLGMTKDQKGMYRTTKNLVNRWIMQMYGEWLVRAGLIADPGPMPVLTLADRAKGLVIPDHIMRKLENTEYYRAQEEARKSSSSGSE